MNEELKREIKERFGNELVLNDSDLVYVTGTLIDPLVFSHEINGQNFFRTMIAVARSSGTVDNIQLIISERNIIEEDPKVGEYLEVFGMFRSRNKKDANGKSHLDLYIFCKGIHVLNTKLPKDENCIFLDGYVCKQPTYRITPLQREIADVFLAVNRGNFKSDYIPCIAWGRNARYLGSQCVGTHIQILGRMQSRKYFKESENLEREIHEISINDFSMQDY